MCLPHENVGGFFFPFVFFFPNKQLKEIDFLLVKTGASSFHLMPFVLPPPQSGPSHRPRGWAGQLLCQALLQRKLSDGRSCLSCQPWLPAPSGAATCRPHRIPVAWQGMESKSSFAFDYSLPLQLQPSSGCCWSHFDTWRPRTRVPIPCVFSSLLLYFWRCENCRRAVHTCSFEGSLHLLISLDCKCGTIQVDLSKNWSMWTKSTPGSLYCHCHYTALKVSSVGARCAETEYTTYHSYIFTRMSLCSSLRK